ncbi:MAG: response regulator transcription factor [Planctomycetes bacterium]|nr:response regulator transcription factor [Planctomycetota bacterium]
MPKPRVLIVEDEADIRELIEYALTREGLEAETAADGTAGLAAVRRRVPDLVLLDLMLPGVDGLEVCRRLKADDATSKVPIIMVTAKGDESDVVLGLGLGADDYVAKPFSPKELVARVQAVLRRSRSATSVNDKQVIDHGPVRIDPNRHKVFVLDDEVPLTATEFRILLYLASRPGRVFSRDQILAFALGPNTIVTDRSVDVHIRAIRKKLGEHRDLVETVRGIGYRFSEEPAVH